MKVWTAVGWTAAGSWPSTALASEWHFWRSMRVFINSLKRAFCRFMDDKAKWCIENREREKVSLMLTGKDVFGSVWFCAFLRELCPFQVSSFQRPSPVRFDRDRRMWREAYKWISKKVTSHHFYETSLPFICSKRCLCNYNNRDWANEILINNGGAEPKNDTELMRIWDLAALIGSWPFMEMK